MMRGGSFAALKGSGLRPKGSLALRARGEFFFQTLGIGYDGMLKACDAPLGAINTIQAAEPRSVVTTETVCIACISEICDISPPSGIVCRILRCQESVYDSIHHTAPGGLCDVNCTACVAPLRGGK